MDGRCKKAKDSVIIPENDVHFIFAGETETDGLRGVIEKSDFRHQSLARLKGDGCREVLDQRVFPIGVLIDDLAISWATGDADDELLAQFMGM